ncbi:hypothetical protein DSECCO2_488670 [anaerobic digester metagenome]
MSQRMGHLVLSEYINSRFIDDHKLRKYLTGVAKKGKARIVIDYDAGQYVGTIKTYEIGETEKLFEGTQLFSVQKGDFEKALTIISEIKEKIDFSKGQHISVSYEPEGRTKILFMKDE